MALAYVPVISNNEEGATLKSTTVLFLRKRSASLSGLEKSTEECTQGGSILCCRENDKVCRRQFETDRYPPPPAQRLDYCHCDSGLSVFSTWNASANDSMDGPSSRSQQTSFLTQDMQRRTNSERKGTVNQNPPVFGIVSPRSRSVGRSPSSPSWSLFALFN